jgi:release factor glutamine methyltransferase
VTALDKLKELSLLLKREGIEDHAKEATTLLTETLCIDKVALHTGPLEIDEKIAVAIDSFAARRIQGEPLHYIIGRVNFYGLRIHVGKGVLIPRPETELMVEEAIKLITGREGSLFVLDLCTGSGCIALALAKGNPHAVVLGIDRSENALSYARINAQCNGIVNAVFIEGDLFNPLSSDARFDCIISNPPYIRRNDIAGLQKEIGYEPIEALDGGEDGLDFYRRILDKAPSHLKKNGVVMLEIGFDQADDIRKLATGHGFKDIRFVKDYAGIERIFIGEGL